MYRSAITSRTHFSSQEYLLNAKHSSLDMGLPLGVFAYSSFGVRGSLALRTLRDNEASQPDEIIKLPPYQNVNAPLGVALRARRSVRQMSGNTMALQTLSTILFYADGVTGEFTLASDDADLLPKHALGETFVGQHRTAPSGGGLNPIYLYLAIQNVEKLQDGIYMYMPTNHSLRRISIFNEKTKQEFLSLGPDWGMNIEIKTVNISIFYVYYLFDNTRKYGDMGLMFGLIETGQIAQNIHLICTALKIASTDIGGWNKVPSETLLGVDGLSKHLIHLTLVGMA